jgi:hypothetical protein
MTMHALERGWKHFSRNISKPFTGANVENLRALDKLLREIEQQGYDATPERLNPSQNPQKFSYGKFDFTWLTALSDDEFRAMHNGWRLVLQVALRGGGAGAGRIALMDRQRLVEGPGTPQMWKDLQAIKDRYRTLAKEKVKGFVGASVEKLKALATKLEDAIHQSKVFGVYASYYSTASTIYERAQDDGAANDMQRKILAAGGLYKLIKSGVTLGRTIASFGADFSAVKSVVQSSLGALNSLGGLLGGIVDLARGREADYRRLTARLGVEQGVDRLIRRLRDKDQEALGEQLDRGAHRLQRGADLTEETLVTLAREMRHAKFWMDTFVKDLAEIKRELAEPPFISELKDRLASLRRGDDEDGGVIKPSELLKVEVAERNTRAALLQRANEAELHNRRFSEMLGNELKKMQEYLAAVETRRSLAGQQLGAVGAGQQFDTARSLAQQAASFDRSRLRPAGPPPPRPAPAPDALRDALAARRRAIAGDDDG